MLFNNYEKDIERETSKYKVLRDLDCFVLDNSIRESEVGQLRGHVLESKWEVYNEVKKCGFKHTIVGSFSHMTRVDDVFIKPAFSVKNKLLTISKIVKSKIYDILFHNNQVVYMGYIGRLKYYVIFVPRFSEYRLNRKTVV
jgi:hypothetical protein